MTLVNVLSGAVTPSGATVIARVTGTSTRLAVADNAALTGPAYFGPVVPTAEGVAAFSVTGLTADTRYWYGVEDDSVLDTDHIGQFRTHGVAGDPYSFTFGHATCAGLGTAYPASQGLAPDRVSDHPVFDEIRAQNPLFFVHGGDLHYYDAGSGVHVPDASVGTYRDAYDAVLSTRQGDLYRNVPLVYMWDDHCYGPNDSDGSFAFKANPAQVYRERVPHYPLATGDTGTDAIYHSFQVGRVLFMLTDGRYYRDPVTDPAPRSMFGATQLSWMDSLLASSDAELLCWVQEQDWTADVLGGTSWGSYTEERDSIVTMLGDNGWLNKMFMVCGDSHAMAYDTGGGRNAAHGGFPILMHSPLDATLTAGPTYDLGRRGSTTGGSRGQWGTVQITDPGPWIRVTGTGWYWA